MGTDGQTGLLIRVIQGTEISLFAYQRQIRICVLRFKNIEIRLVRQGKRNHNICGIRLVWSKMGPVPFTLPFFLTANIS